MTSVITAIFGVFTGVGEWLITFIPSIFALFWTAEGGLTFLGTLALVSLAISVFFLIAGFVQNFLHFRG